MRAAPLKPPSPESAQASLQASELIRRLLENLERAIRGKREALELVLCCVAAGGHVLLEDVPGTGKTTLAKALALSIGGAFKRVQFTPDLLPTDIVGASIFNPQDGSFRFRQGPRARVKSGGQLCRPSHSRCFCSRRSAP